MSHRSFLPALATAAALAAAAPAAALAEPDFAPDYVVRAAGFMPNDPGRRSDGLGGWTKLQWNFFGPASVNAPDAWEYARAAGVPGGRGAVVAVVDSGVAYERRGGFRRAPDLYAGRFVKPY